MFDKKKVDNSIDCAYHKSNIFFYWWWTETCLFIKRKEFESEFLAFMKWTRSTKTFINDIALSDMLSSPQYINSDDAPLYNALIA